MLAAVQKQFPGAYAYGESAVETVHTTWKATDDYIRKNRNVLLAYLGAWTLVITYFGSIHGPSCAMRLTKGMVVGSVTGLVLGISSVKVLIPKYDAIEEPEGSEGASVSSHSSELYGQVGRRPHLHTLGRAAFWALENLDAKVTRAVVLTIFVQTIFGAIPVFPTTLGCIAGLVVGDEISYVAATEGLHIPDFTEDLSRCEQILVELERCVDSIQVTIVSCQVPEDINAFQKQEGENLEQSYTTDNSSITRFYTERNQYTTRKAAIEQACSNLRESYNKICSQAQAETISQKGIKSILRSISRFTERVQERSRELLQIEKELAPWCEGWEAQWNLLRARQEVPSQQSDDSFLPSSDDEI